MKQVKEGLILPAFCWAHVRRDSLDVARSWPSEEGRALAWVGRTGRLYQLDEARPEVREQPRACAEKDEPPRQMLAQMKEQARTELSEAGTHPARQEVLSSLQEHRDGLTAFVGRPEVPLDNNTAERVPRGPVVGRKNYRGWGAVWSGASAAALFSVFQTLCLWGLNPRVWLEAYPQECARAGGQAPEQLGESLPWQMTEEKRKRWPLGTEAEGEGSS
jgi:transposase